MLLTQVSRFREAVADFDRAVTLRPGSTLAIYRRGIAKHCLGDLDGAIADYDLIMALEPGCADSAPGASRRRGSASKHSGAARRSENRSKR